MNKKEKIIVLDVETAGSLGSPLVYDLGFIITNKEGKIFEKYQFIISDIFDNSDLMKTAYYYNKLPKYLQGLEDKKMHKVSFAMAYATMQHLIKKYNIKNVFAYNAYFDSNALNNTIRTLTEGQKKYFFPYGTQINCIWNMACQVLYTQKTFYKEAIKNGWFTENGNLKTSAEIGFRYISGLNEFDEEHMGLQDALIETMIMTRCFRQNKKMERNVNRLCWKIPTEFHKMAN